MQNISWGLVEERAVDHLYSKIGFPNDPPASLTCLNFTKKQLLIRSNKIKLATYSLVIAVRYWLERTQKDIPFKIGSDFHFTRNSNAGVNNSFDRFYFELFGGD